MSAPKFSPASPNHAGEEKPPKAGRPAFGNGVGQSARPEGVSPVTFAPEECEEAMRTLLAEVAPHAEFRVLQSPLGHASPCWSAHSPFTLESTKASYLTLLRLQGPDLAVRCAAHLDWSVECDRIPVAWALLGHTCGRES